MSGKNHRLQKDCRELQAVLEVTGNSYRVIKYLGEGSFSKVFLVKHNIFDELRVLKIMDRQYLLKLAEQDISDIKSRFFLEAKMYKKIDSPYIVRVFEVGTVDPPNKKIQQQRGKLEIPYIIMQYIRGLTLREFMEQNTPLNIERAFDITRDILKAVKIIHQNGIVHRDIKPANIIIQADGQAVLIDFGIARELRAETRLTTTGMAMGTSLYMAPEQFVDCSRVGFAADIYSVGVVMYEMLMGETPFPGIRYGEIMYGHLEKPVPDVTRRFPKLPKQIDRIIKKTMAKKPKNRYQTVDQLLIELRNLQLNNRQLFLPKPGDEDEPPLKDMLPGNEPIQKRFFFLKPGALVPLLSILLVIIVSLAAGKLFKPDSTTKKTGNPNPTIPAPVINTGLVHPVDSEKGRLYIATFPVIDEENMSVMVNDAQALWINRAILEGIKKAGSSSGHFSVNVPRHMIPVSNINAALLAFLKQGNTNEATRRILEENNVDVMITGFLSRHKQVKGIFVFKMVVITRHSSNVFPLKTFISNDAQRQYDDITDSVEALLQNPVLQGAIKLSYRSE